MMRNSILSSCLLLVGICKSVNGLAYLPPRQIQTSYSPSLNSRRAFLSTTAATLTSLALPQITNARYILNEETGDYDEVADEDWQTAWGKRLDKAKSMSTEEVFLAAQGAGNVNQKENESDVSKKRRALAGCRNGGMREKAGGGSEKECAARVLGGDIQFMLDAL
ncbi:predicted protein [Thalassiosira pseudonana CCMP1335]|jgi:hypothetical protein|uniref:Uncharacterized protein n=1 Tax=Thalassiosira pseudonana TaxID=35128 RepID=B8BTI9_THAPS|nr:predicted protein [Thalassiosira pseudonana CCMP1335]EED94610.1 predicted protein [Thalassiosira pseudonana CCMP1335]|eukprot:scaffold2748_cov193-Alexandrium_tamarense.AAC.9